MMTTKRASQRPLSEGWAATGWVLLLGWVISWPIVWVAGMLRLLRYTELLLYRPTHQFCQ